MLSKSIFDVMRAMPIFKPQMRKANRDGLKSQTRRVIEPQIEWQEDIFQRRKSGTIDQFSYSEFIDTCPYGKVGDYCCMREPLVRGFGDVAYYRDDGVMVRHALTGESITWRWNVKTLSGMFMPKEAARSIYQYEFIRVERVQDISHEDAVAEGCYEQPGKTWGRLGYSQLWDKINFARGFGWQINPWVWVLGYRPVAIFTPGNKVK